MAFEELLLLFYCTALSTGLTHVAVVARSGGMGSPRQNIGGLAERGLVDASTSPRSSYTGGRRGGTGNRAARAAGN